METKETVLLADAIRRFGVSQEEFFDFFKALNTLIGAGNTPMEAMEVVWADPKNIKVIKAYTLIAASYLSWEFEKFMKGKEKAHE